MAYVILVFIILLILGMPVSFTIGISGAVFFLQNSFVPLSIVAQKAVSATQSFPLLAIPFFVLAGNLMNATGITPRLIKLATVLTGHMKGGLAQVSVVLSSLMGGISGSATADAAMEARILGPDMIERGYSKGYAAVTVSLPSLITATIPPSMGLIIYGFVGEVSIGRLFAAGLIPGILMMIFLMIAVSITANKKGYMAVRASRVTFKELLVALKESIWAIIFPLILIVGIRFGLFTPSEAGAFASVYALLVGVFIYKELTWEKFLKVLDTTVEDLGAIMLIISFAGIFGYGIVFDRIPQVLSGFIINITTNPISLIFIILLFLALCGMFVETTALVLLLTPIFLPLVQQVGIDPVHFGILMMTIVTMGIMTPPVGIAMYTVCSILDCPTEKYTRESIPFFIAILLEVVILVLFPQIVLFLPNFIFG
ncbi:TRAP transporter large permease subunit [Iocasia frigidifontis]|uniref:TRAP transporter large permease subunit n=1 Tax=Iocasia fonsfrigidae TaxID=2682810 RepID=A0A8A7KCV0_9FIRM|nr:TRAP transporter large permease [Iocasia fonsfrigidae]QTL99673.1 TRAP transporter large permease subunit [Iocasia fonsfrigidae]